MLVLSEILANLKGNEPPLENCESSEHFRQNFEINCFPKKGKNGMGQLTAISFSPLTKWNKNPSFNSQLSYTTLNRVPRFSNSVARVSLQKPVLWRRLKKKRPKILPNKNFHAFPTYVLLTALCNWFDQFDRIQICFASSLNSMHWTVFFFFFKVPSLKTSKNQKRGSPTTNWASLPPLSLPPTTTSNYRFSSFSSAVNFSVFFWGGRPVWVSIWPVI